MMFYLLFMLMVQAEFRMPFYRNPEKVDVVVEVSPEDCASEACVMLRSVETGMDYDCGTIALGAGSHTYWIEKNIASLPAGRYDAFFKVGDDTLKRMLRIDRVPEPQLPDGPVCQKKMLVTPDGWLFSKTRNVDLMPGRAELVEAYNTTESVSPTALQTIDPELYRLADGCFVVKVSEQDYVPDTVFSSPRRDVYVVGETPEGPFTVIDSLPEAVPADAQLRMLGNLNGGYLENRKYELYDPARHGTYGLKDVRIMRHQYNFTDYGFGPSPDRSYWVVARTSTGDVVFLRDTPLFVDHPIYYGDEIDNGFMTNDNFGNSWFSADGRTLYHIQGQAVRRFYPFDTPFDVLHNAARLATLYSTTDGVNWKYEHVISPLDSPACQHYGLTVRYDEDAGIYIGYINAYDTDYQQIYLDITYSRNGVDFYRVPGSHFVRVTEKDGAFYNDMFCGVNIYRSGNWCYQAVQGQAWPHFYPEAGYWKGIAGLDGFTPEVIRAEFESRNLAERFARFEEYGGYEGISESMQHPRASVGILKFRADGWYAAVAGRRTGRLVSREITGGGTLTVNADIRGWMKVCLADESGRTIKKVRLEGDSAAHCAFELPSEGTYKIKVRMKDADLYSLSRE